MNDETLLRTNAYLGFIGGLATFCFRIMKGILFILALDGEFSSSIAIIIFGLLMLLTGIIRLASFTFAILALSRCSNNIQLSNAAPILLILAFVINSMLILGIIADILSIIGGTFFLVALNKLNDTPPIHHD